MLSPYNNLMFKQIFNLNKNRRNQVITPKRELFRRRNEWDNGFQ